MAFLGRIRAGSKYTVTLKADASNHGVTISNIGWTPKIDPKLARNFPLAAAPGTSGRHEETCPPEPDFQAIVVAVDVPGSPALATINWTGIVSPLNGKDITVLQDDRYWVEVIP